jgi:hypothetical protein
MALAAHIARIEAEAIDLVVPDDGAAVFADDGAIRLTDERTAAFGDLAALAANLIDALEYLSLRAGRLDGDRAALRSGWWQRALRSGRKRAGRWRRGRPRRCCCGRLCGSSRRWGASRRLRLSLLRRWLTGGRSRRPALRGWRLRGGGRSASQLPEAGLLEQ